MQHSTDSTAPDVPSSQVAANESAADVQPPGDGREQGATQEAGGTEQKAATRVHSTSPIAAVQASARLDRYDYDRTSILLVAHFRPAIEGGQPRQVWLSAQNGVGNEQDFPLYRVLSVADLGGPWPPAVAQLLEDLRQDLPDRRQRYEARQATQSNPVRHQTPAATTSTRHGKAPAAATHVPTTSTPIPKQELGMDGLFEGLE